MCFVLAMVGVDRFRAQLPLWGRSRLTTCELQNGLSGPLLTTNSGGGSNVWPVCTAHHRRHSTRPHAATELSLCWWLMHIRRMRVGVALVGRCVCWAQGSPAVPFIPFLPFRSGRPVQAVPFPLFWPARFRRSESDRVLGLFTLIRLYLGMESS